MPVNQSLAALSEGCLLATVVMYALAMLAFAGDLAFGERGSAQAAALTVPALALPEAVPVSAVPVGVGGGSAGPAAPVSPPGDSAPPSAPAPRKRVRPATGPWTRAALVLTVVGLLTHVTAVASRGFAEHRVPWGNMYEFVTAITCVAVMAFLIVLARYRIYSIGLFVMTPIVVILGLAATLLYTAAGPVVPALQSYWIAIHVTSMVIAIGGYLVAAVLTVLFLLADGIWVPGPLQPAVGALMTHLPSRETLDRVSYRVVIFAFPIWTWGIIAGAIWADQAWGRYWGWDPVETWAFITWVVYACFLHARATAGWRGKRAAYIQILGFSCLLFNVLVVQTFVTGLHSYAGLS